MHHATGELNPVRAPQAVRAGAATFATTAPTKTSMLSAAGLSRPQVPERKRPRETDAEATEQPDSKCQAVADEQGKPVKKRPARPTPMAEDLAAILLRDYNATLTGGTASVLPAKVMGVYPSHRLSNGTPVYFIPLASPHANGKLSVLGSRPAKPSIGTECRGLFVMHNKVTSVLPGVAVLVQTKSAKTQTVGDIIAHWVPGVGKVPPFDDSMQILEYLQDVLGHDTLDNIPSFELEAMFEFGAKLFSMLNTTDDLDTLVGLIAPVRDSESPWNYPADNNRIEPTQLLGLIQTIVPYLEATAVAKQRVRRRPAEIVSKQMDTFDDTESDVDNEEEEAPIPLPPPPKPAPSKPKDVFAKPAPPPPKPAPVKPKDVFAKPAPPTPALPAAKPAAAKPLYPVLVRSPEQRAPVLQLPVVLYLQMRELFDQCGVADFSDEAEMVSLTLTASTLAEETVAKFGEVLDVPDTLALIAEIRMSTALAQTILVDCNDMSDPISVIQPDGTQLHGTLVSRPAVQSSAYQTLLEWVLSAHMRIADQQQEAAVESGGDGEEDEEDE